jgi:hypothetical protein
MFLLSSVQRSLHKKLHGLLAAHQLTLARMENLHDVPTDFTPANLQSFLHFMTFLLSCGVINYNHFE